MAAPPQERLVRVALFWLMTLMWMRAEYWLMKAELCDQKRKRESGHPASRVERNGEIFGSN